MTKSQLIDKIYQQNSGLSKSHIALVTETVFDVIKNSLAKGERVEIRNFGNFNLRKRGPRKARNPKTGKLVDVAEKNVPFFKAGKELKEIVNS
jgi:integration host factor subunit beta